MSGGPRDRQAAASEVLQVTAGVIARANEILICQRPEGARHAGKWEFPGGKREGNETLPECLRRELDEELGIVAEIGEQLWQETHCYPNGRPFELFFFRVRSYTGEPENKAFAQIRWVPLGTLGGFDFLEADRTFVSHLDRGDWNLGRIG